MTQTQTFSHKLIVTFKTFQNSNPGIGSLWLVPPTQVCDNNSQVIYLQLLHTFVCIHKMDNVWPFTFCIYM